MPIKHMKSKYCAIIVVAIMLTFLTGCSRANILITPQSLTSGGPIKDFSINTFKTNLTSYTSAMKSKDYGLAQVLRDQMINGIRIEIEMNYRDFEQNLYNDRAIFNTSADIVELALAGAATITGGEAAKTILSGILTAAKGGRLSYDKNFFREKTTEAIIASMQAGRSKKLTQIINGMNLTVQKYPFEQAWVDLVDFFYAGTIEGGLLALTTEAGNKAETNKKELQQAEKYHISKATREQIDSVGSLTDQVDNLRKAADQSIAGEKAKRILNALRVNFDPTATNEQLYEKLQEQIDAATENQSLLPGLIEAFEN